MKTYMGVCLLALAVNAPAMSALQKPSWETVSLRTPESVLVHEFEDRKVLLVSEIEGGHSDVDGAGGIAMLALDGTIIEQDFVRGLNAPKGMAVFEDTLYVADITELVAIDLTTQKVIARHVVEDAVFLNDVAVDERGAVYVTDTRVGKVHRLVNGELDLYHEGLAGANGLYTEGTDLYVGAGSQLFRLSGDGGKAVIAEGFAENVDGVEAVNGGGFIVSCWAGLVYYVEPDGTLNLLLDSRAEEVNTADIGYDSESHTLFVPTFHGSSVRAYSL
ncbi:SMP-30/gluconolactonase/LRE family protein [Gilvimarinus agarilyticus]|uniref:SMP-30/gluconolactonase/LRE family protein n=1 Tax=Gilvimarinus agarilyticus TaxID=679259 RepID=UPI00059FF7D3|nr:hypothetical protein [Gilvimarinus agarilyticus]